MTTPRTWKVYPHWLDGEFVRIAANAHGPDQNVRDFVRAVKLHALLGTHFVLNDVQVFDSAAVLALFADQTFRDFVKHDRHLFDLKVEPDPTLGDGSFAHAARGLVRTVSPGWLSSVFVQDPTPIKRLAAEIITSVQNEGYLDLDRPSTTIREFPQYQDLLDGVRHAVDYFGRYDKPHEFISAGGARTNYYEVLKSWRDKAEESERTPLIEVLDFIRDEIPEDARWARSSVRAILDRKSQPHLEDTIWNHVVQAWNYATQQTLNPEGGSVGNLSGVASPAQDLDRRRDILLPIDADVLRAARTSARAVHFPYELNDMSWSDIGAARAATVDTREELARARWIGDAEVIRGPLRRHLEKVARVIHVSPNPSGTPIAMMVGAAIGGGVEGAIVAVVGGPPDLFHGLIGGVAAGATGALVGHGAERVVQGFKPWREGRALTNTLMKAVLPESK